MNRIASISALVLFALAAAGSGSGADSSSANPGPVAAPPAAPGAPTAEAPAGRVMYCDASGTALGQCVEYPLAESFGEDVVREQCTAIEGTLSESPCPTEGRIGTCRPNLGHNVRYYYATQHQYTVSSASAECSMLRNGTWTAD